MSDEHESPQISDAELLAYLDGELEPERAREIEQARSYGQRLSELAQEERQLSARLYRSVCPDPHTLGEYHLQLLSETAAASIAAHLSICPHCAEELQQLETFLDELAPELDYSLAERVKILVAQLMPDLGAPGVPSIGGLAPAGVRGGDDRPLLYSAEDVQVSLEVQDDASGAERRTVLGLVIGVDAEDWPVHLWRDEEAVADATVDELGNFIFEQVEPDTYRLLLDGGQVVVHIPELIVS